MPRTGGATEQGPPEITSKLSTDELIKRLKACLNYLSDCSELKDANTSSLNKLSSSLLLSFLHNHRSREVRALTAAGIVEVFRLFHPNHPYVDEDLKTVFSLFVAQLKGLENPTGPAFKQAFQLLESLVKLQLFLLCLTLEPPDIIADLFKVVFSVISDLQTAKVRNYLMELLVSMLQEVESFSQEILDSILGNIIDPIKTTNRPLCTFTVELIRKASSSIEPLIHRFFNSMLVIGNSSESELGHSLYELIYELYAIDSSLLLSVLPQLEHKLRSADINERRQVTEVLAKMFSPKGSKLAKENRPLWNCFLGRFYDASQQIRILCTSFSKLFLLNHPHLCEDVSGKLHDRVLDKEEKVRVGVVKVLMETAQDNIKALPKMLVDDMVGRLRDKSWAVRKEAMIGLAKLYRKLMSSSSSSDIELKPSLIRTYSWIPTKLLHCYYMDSAEDRLCVERCVLSCLVPVSYGCKDRMLRLMHVYARLDEPATRAFDRILLCRHHLRRKILALANAVRSGKLSDEDDTKKTVVRSLILPIARVLPEPMKTQTALQDLVKILLADEEMVDSLFKIVDPVLACEQIQGAKTELLNRVKDKEPVKEMIKNLADASGRVLLDSQCIMYLVEQASQILCDCPMGDSQEEEDDQLHIAKSSVRLLKVVAPFIPECFASDKVLTSLVDVLNHTDLEIAKQALQIFISVGKLFDAKVTSCLQPILTKLATSGPPQLAKHAVLCIHHVFKDPQPIFNKLCSSLAECVDYEHPNYHTVLVSLGEVAKLQPDLFSPLHKTVVKEKIVKNLFLVDRDETVYEYDPDSEHEWCEDVEVSYEAKAKVLAMKLLVNWLVGDSSGGEKSASPVVRMFSRIIFNNGDLQQRDHVSPTDMSRLRLGAACGLLKLASCSHCAELITAEQYLSLACVIQDPCAQVRSLFAAKVNKKLSSGQLPFSYLSIFALAGNEPVKSERQALRNMVAVNVERRRKVYSELTGALKKSHLLPEYVIPHVVYLISHHSQFKRTSTEALDSFKDCLWFFLEPVMVKGDYSFVYKLLETIKLTVDAQHPDDAEINKNIYCTCDLALGLLTTKKTMNVKLGDISGEVVLPSRLYTRKKGNAQKAEPSLKYLPPDYDCTPSKQLLIKTEAQGSTPRKNTAKKTTPQKKANQCTSSSKSSLLPKQQKGSKLSGFATSTPAIKPTRGRPPVKGSANSRKRKGVASGSEEEEVSDVEEGDENSQTSDKTTDKPQKGSPKKRNVRRKVFKEAAKEKDAGEIDSVGVGESGASPSVVRRSRRKMVVQEAEVNHKESTEAENDSESESKPSPKKRKTKNAAGNKAKVPADEARSTSSGIKRKARHRR